MMFNELKIGCLLAWNKGRGKERFLQDECFRYKARARFTSYHIRRCHIGSNRLNKRQGSYSLNACITRCHLPVTAGRQDNLHGHARAQQALDSPINCGRPLRTSLEKDGKYSGIKTKGCERFASFACRDF